jgi:arylsulfatase A-like enzyme
MKPILSRYLFTLLAGAFVLVGATLATADDPKPNIIYIIADDLGWKDVGFHGSDIKTPNLDKLAAGGAKLEQFYAQPMCTPTRAALMTGRYPFRYGLQTLVIPSAHTYGLATDEWLLPQALKDAGYNTALIGKWHLGHADPKYWPCQRGFDYHYGPLIGELDYFTHKQHGVTDWYRNNKVVNEEGYTTTLLGNDAVKWIDQQNASKPFFLDLSFNAPHAPYQAPQEYLDMYKNIEDPSRRAYAASITAMDDQIGRVVEALDKKKLRDNTLIVFQSDNGGTRDAMFSGEIDTSKLTIPCDNGPYREGKGTLYEGGTRVCALANWPGHIQPGITVDGIIHTVDFYPTLTGLAGASTAKSKPLDGVNVWTTVSTNAPSPRTEVVYNVEPFRAGIREGDWKLVWRTPLPASVELYNIAQDPSEKTNLADKYPDKVAELEKRANELAAAGVKPLLLQEIFKSVRQGLRMPPALPGSMEEFQLDTEPGAEAPPSH